METIKIMHTNDLHSHFENFPKIKRYIDDNRKKHTEDEFYLFDIGDAMDRAHPLTEASDGQANISWLNSLHYDAATVGNNEGLGNSHEILEHLYDNANFPVVLGNLYEKNSHELARFAKPYLIIETKKHSKIGILGLTAPFILTYPLVDWDIHLVQEMLPKWLGELKNEKCDVIVLLSHLGVSMDRLIASKYQDIDVIIGSHTHHLFKNGEMDDGVLLAAAGKYGYYVGSIELTIDDNKKVISKYARTQKTSDLPESPGDKAWIEKQLDTGNALLSAQKIARIPNDLTLDLHDENAVIQTGLDAIIDYTKADAGILSSGLFLKGLKAGEVTAKDLHDMLPHAIHAMKTTMRGSDIWWMIMEMEKNRPYLRSHQQKGMGFRGKIFGELVYRGITVDEKRNVYINNEKLQMDKEYTLALLDHYLFVPYFPAIEIVGNNEILYPKFLRNVFGDYLKKKYPM
ncbi:bifunctional metallophosphatase/5'-nucleotidase [Companilactobacillus allii]|uniref:Multifunctional 2',3'-cyclic-nucleotide 2'-phosphodiesterase/5'-nucleotidase/3'-nucleotidase n=1 Tax=Companilactobacillus allii TaxID=1847728 RepID=A0A1P8PZI2_9LACO|nr:bifunctional UDP-sugar hydrolase/5'-nucleotidase [Companilactobacillus allii]APX71034.1 multifunctional 2',3'-cyclic-nucleotide 2'-phosphodiesterase/5'-nucleotidase/3'-nucleotidase [Companilactobacillus allii]USQ68112.1 bifunctional metallophosphatase/5'-nucleotidase [Companilactobacillus allii]